MPLTTSRTGIHRAANSICMDKSIVSCARCHLLLDATFASPPRDVGLRTVCVSKVRSLSQLSKRTSKKNQLCSNHLPSTLNHSRGLVSSGVIKKPDNFHISRLLRHPWCGEEEYSFRPPLPHRVIYMYIYGDIYIYIYR